MKKVGLIFCLLSFQLQANIHVFHVFPVVAEYKSVRGKMEPQWYLLLGKNAEKDVAFKKGMYQELGGTKILNQKNLHPGVIEGFALEYLTNQTKGIYGEGDLTSLLKKERRTTDSRLICMPNILDKEGVNHQVVFMLLDVRKPLARLNTDGRNEYKTEFQWKLVSEILGFNSNQLGKMGIEPTLTNYSEQLRSFQKDFMSRLCESRKKSA